MEISYNDAVRRQDICVSSKCLVMHITHFGDEILHDLSFQGPIGWKVQLIKKSLFNLLLKLCIMGVNNIISSFNSSDHLLFAVYPGGDR